MRVNEFIEKYNSNPRIDIGKLLEVKKYISIVYKQHIADLVLDNCTDIVDGEVHINSVDRYILFTMAVISAHTNLEFAYEDDSEYSSLYDYDLLCESGLLSKVIDTFKEDYLSCQEILNMMTSDRLQNNMTIENKLYKFFDSIQEILAQGINKLTENLDGDLINNMQLDENNLSQLLNLIGNK